MRVTDDSSEAISGPCDTAVSDKIPAGCQACDKPPTLPAYARLPLNRCNLPAVILGGLTFQTHPAVLELDGVLQLHHAFFAQLDAEPDPAIRRQRFVDYMTLHFRLERLEDAGYSSASARGRANWRRLLRGWSFDADGLEGAALKAWVESRFGLLPRFHGRPLRDDSGPAWHRYEEMRARALYGANALEAQLDLLYTYGQYESGRCGEATAAQILYRGVNRLDDHELLRRDVEGSGDDVVLFNSLTSFSSSRERAGEFGDTLLQVIVPNPKIMFHCRLLPGLLQGEDEFLVIGGAYRVRRLAF